MKPLVTVVCPTYNRARYMPTAIRCFRQQTYPNLEMIIVDDGTEKFDIPSDDRIRYIHLDNRIPTGSKRNLGAQEARGEIIAAQDDDDWYSAHRIEDQIYRLLTSGKAVTGYHSTVIYNEEDGKIFFQRGGPPYYVSGASQVYLKTWWKDHPFPDASLGEDAAFGRLARMADQLVTAPCGQMMVVRRHANNTCERTLGRTPELNPRDVSPYFFEDLKFAAVGHVCTPECHLVFQKQIREPMPDYQVDWLPEIEVK